MIVKELLAYLKLRIRINPDVLNQKLVVHFQEFDEYFEVITAEQADGKQTERGELSEEQVYLTVSNPIHNKPL